MNKLLFAATLASACASASAAGFMNTHTLLTQLNVMEMQLLSYGYIMGIADADDGNLFCLPNNISSTELTRVVVRAHLDKAGATDHLTEPARFFVRKALNKAYPCPSSR